MAHSKSGTNLFWTRKVIGGVFLMAGLAACSGQPPVQSAAGVQSQFAESTGGSNGRERDATGQISAMTVSGGGGGGGQGQTAEATQGNDRDPRQGSNVVDASADTGIDVGGGGYGGSVDVVADANVGAGDTELVSIDVDADADVDALDTSNNLVDIDVETDVGVADTNLVSADVDANLL